MPATESSNTTVGTVLSGTEPVLLIIADISGYTRYMTANAKTLSHSHVIIAELVEAIVREIELPMEVAKLEGDAVFLYCRKASADHAWDESRRIVGGKLLAFFRKFAAKLIELSASSTCSCSACTHIEKLRLKIIVHSGEAIFHRVANFTELAGVDVIVVHRLMKNSVEADQYLLLTEAAHRDLEFPEPLSFFPGSEKYDGIGELRTLVNLPENVDMRAPENADFITRKPAKPARSTSQPATNFPDAWRLWCKLWFAPLVRQPAQKQAPQYAMRRVSLVSQCMLAVLTIVLTPIMLPVGAIFVFRHVWKQSTTSQPHEPGCLCGRHDHPL